MDDSPLSKLARELRDEIWALALTQKDPVISMDELHSCSKWIFFFFFFLKPRTPNRLALTLVCKQVRDEATGVFYKASTLLFPSALVVGLHSTTPGPSRISGVEYTQDLHDRHRNLLPFQDSVLDLGEHNSRDIRRIVVSLGSLELTTRVPLLKGRLVKALASTIDNIERNTDATPSWAVGASGGSASPFNMLCDVALKPSPPYVRESGRLEFLGTFRCHIHLGRCCCALTLLREECKKMVQLVHDVAIAVEEGRKGNGMLA